MSFLIPDTGLLFWTLVIFGIMFFILAKFGFPAITDMINERNLFIEKSLHNAREANEKLATVNAESASLLKAAREEHAKILREAGIARDELLKAAREKAEKEGREILAETRRVMAMEKENVIREIHRQVAEVSVEVAQKLLRRELSDSTKQSSVVEELVKEALENK